MHSLSQFATFGYVLAVLCGANGPGVHPSTLPAKGAGGTTSTRADEKAAALLKEVDSATKAVRTLSADLTLSQMYQGKMLKATRKVRLKKPNFARIEIPRPFDITVASDGKTVYTVLNRATVYVTSPADPNGANIIALWAVPVNLFFQFDVGKLLGAPLTGKEVTLGEPETIEGASYRVLNAALSNGKGQLRLYVGPENLVTRAAITLVSNTDTTFHTVSLTNVKLNQDLSDSSFEFKPPKSAKLYKPPDANPKP